MRITRWLAVGLALLVLVNLGSAAAQGNPPPITPENVAQVQEVQHLGANALKPQTAWSPDGTLAVGGTDGFWLYTALDQAPEFYPLSEPAGVQPFKFAPQGDLLLLSNWRQLVAYDVTQKAIRYTLEGGMQPLAFSHDGAWLAYEVDDGLRIAEVSTGDLVYDLSYVGMNQWPEETGPEDDYTQANSVTYAEFLPGDESLIVRWETLYAATWEGIEDAGYDIWSLAGDASSPVVAQTAYDFVPRFPDLLTVLPDGQLVATQEESIFTKNGSRIFDPAPTRFRFNPRTYVTQGWNVAFAYVPQGVRESRLVGIWDMRTGEQIVALPATGTLAFSPDSTRIAIDTTVYDVATGEVVARLYTENYRILPGTGRVLRLGADDSLHLLDENLQEIAVLDVARSDVFSSTNIVAGMVTVPETHTLLLRTQDAKRWLRIDLDTGATLATYATDDRFAGATALTPDQRYLITGVQNDQRSTYALWDVESGQPVDLPIMTEIMLPVLAPNGLIVLWERESNAVLLYDPVTAQSVMTFPFEWYATSPTPEIRFSPTDTYLSIYTMQELAVWDWQTGEVVLRISDAAYPRFSPDDRLLVYQTSDSARVEVVALPGGEAVWQTDLDFMIDSPEFAADSIVKITPLWVELGDPTCYDMTTLASTACPVSSPPLPVLDTGDLRFFGSGLVTDGTGAELAQLPLPGGALRMALASEHTRLIVEYSDGTLGVWAAAAQ